MAGRHLHGDFRKLIISCGQTGHFALYRFVPALDEIRILAIRHQRERRYRPCGASDGGGPLGKSRVPMRP
jgi:plasmid stabilization system protein ParE